MRLILSAIALILTSACTWQSPNIEAPAIPTPSEYVTREQAIQTANAYIGLQWYASARHRMHPGFPVDYGYPNDAPVWRGVTPSCV